MLKLEIVTPEKRVLDTEVDSVTVPTASGEVGILPNHAPLISALRPGILSYTVKGAATRLAVTGGFVEVGPERVAVLADTAETADEIELDAAKAMRDDAQSALTAIASGSLDDTEAARDRLDGAAARVLLASGK